MLVWGSGFSGDLKVHDRVLIVWILRLEFCLKANLVDTVDGSEIMHWKRGCIKHHFHLVYNGINDRSLSWWTLDFLQWMRYQPCHLWSNEMMLAPESKRAKSGNLKFSFQKHMDGYTGTETTWRWNGSKWVCLFFSFSWVLIIECVVITKSLFANSFCKWTPKLDQLDFSQFFALFNCNARPTCKSWPVGNLSF